MIEAFPLQWPPSWPRTKYTERHPNMVRNFTRNRDEVVKQLDMLGASSIVMSTNMQLRKDGLPYSGQKQPEDTGVAVYFSLNGEQQCVPCDKWDTVDQNLRAIALTIEALRGIERWGAKEMVNAAFRGFKALPQPIITPEPTRPHRDWWIVLGVYSDAKVEQVRSAYREALKLHHPDVGGNLPDFKEVQQAFKEWKQS